MICDKCEETMDEEKENVVDIRFREGLTIHVHWRCWLLAVAGVLFAVARSDEIPL